MLRSKPALIVLVATTVSLTVVGPLPLWLRALLTIGVLLVLLVLFLLLLSPGLLLLLFLLLFLLALGLPLLILICGLRLLLLLFLLALGLLLFLFARPDCLLFLGLGLLLVLFGFGLLILLSIRGARAPRKRAKAPIPTSLIRFISCSSITMFSWATRSSVHAWLLLPAVVDRVRIGLSVWGALALFSRSPFCSTYAGRIRRPNPNNTSLLGKQDTASQGPRTDEEPANEQRQAKGQQEQQQKQQQQQARTQQKQKTTGTQQHANGQQRAQPQRSETSWPRYAHFEGVVAAYNRTPGYCTVDTGIARAFPAWFSHRTCTSLWAVPDCVLGKPFLNVPGRY